MSARQPDTATEASRPSVVSVHGLTVMYDGQRPAVRAVDDVTLEIAAGETFVVIGESGSGKSTLLKAIAGLVTPAGGTVEVHAGAAQPAGPGRRPGLAQIVFQDPDLALNPRQPVWKSVAEPLVPRRLRIPSGLRARALELLTEVGLGAEIADRKPHELSGGQRQRVTIARAMASGTSLVLLDEPVSAQDVSLQASILRLLTTFQRDRSLTYIIVSHDVAAVGRLANRVGVMYAAKLVEVGPAEEILARPRHPYTRALIAAVPVISAEPGSGARPVIQGEPPDLRNPPSGCRFRTRCMFAIERCATEEPELGHAALHADDHKVACHRWQEIPDVPPARPRQSAEDRALFRSKTGRKSC
jgi:oligopeptide/dipeptide ABC transporter ATP-binding protein